jgi:uroporphyrin-III C-methyltransferase
VSPGKVFLVGAGPGHPDLLTVKAHRLIGQADVIVYDRLVQEECLAHARKDAELIYVGKAPGRHDSRQAEINDVLARKSSAGSLVLRLKGGDSLLFSRGGEEAQYLAARGIPFEFVPGVTSALAAPAAAGIPVTHRDLASSYCVVTGHERADGGEGTKHDWAALARIDTLAVLMGVKNLERIAGRLMQHGKSPDTPAALVQKAYWPGERVLFAPLGEIASRSVEEGIEPPAVLLVGEVVGTHTCLEQIDRDLSRDQASAPEIHVRNTPGSSMRYPIHLALEGGRVLMVGGGAVAERRVRRLLEAGSRVRIVSPVLSEELGELRDRGAVEHTPRGFEPADLEGAILAFAATDDAAVNRQVADEARRRGILVNVADDPIACDFTLPACVVRGSLVVSVSTNARSPGLAAALRRRLEIQFGPEWAELTRMLSDIRPDLLRLGLSSETIAGRIDTVLESNALGLIREGQEEEARTAAARILLPDAV